MSVAIPAMQCRGAYDESAASIPNTMLECGLIS